MDTVKPKEVCLNMERLLMNVLTLILMDAIKDGQAHMDVMLCPGNTPRCPAIHTNGDVIPLIPKYVTKQDGGMLTPVNVNHRLTINMQCTLPACLSSPCMNQGHCSEDINGFICDCVGDYLGYTCERTRPMCEKVICLNGGTCYDDETIGFYCLCDPCFFGEFCEKDYDPYYDLPSSFEPSFMPVSFTPLEHNVTVNDTFYLGPSQTVENNDCSRRKSDPVIFWHITTPNGTFPAITIYHFNTFDDIDGLESLIVSNTRPTENFTDVQEIRNAMNLVKLYDDVGLWIPEVGADLENQAVLLFAQGNLSLVLPYTVRASSNSMFCVFTSLLQTLSTERYTSVMAKVRVVYPDQM